MNEVCNQHKRFTIFSSFTIFQDWILVKEGKTCDGADMTIEVNTIAECADRCAGNSSMFGIDTLMHCTCPQHASIDGTCAHVDKANNVLYKYVPKGMNLHIILKVTTISIGFLYFSCAINRHILQCFNLNYFRPNYIAA